MNLYQLVVWVDVVAAVALIAALFRGHTWHLPKLYRLAAALMVIGLMSNSIMQVVRFPRDVLPLWAFKDIGICLLVLAYWWHVWRGYEEPWHGAR